MIFIIAEAHKCFLSRKTLEHKHFLLPLTAKDQTAWLGEV